MSRQLGVRTEKLQGMQAIFASFFFTAAASIGSSALALSGLALLRASWQARKATGQA
jgi:hypothetical protein